MWKPGSESLNSTALNWGEEGVALTPGPTGDHADGLTSHIEPATSRTESPEFFLRSLQVRNFRAIDETTFVFQPGLNVIIGANNAAKTAAIDALRLVFGQGSYEKREDPIRLRPTDVYVNENRSGARQISFAATFFGRRDSSLPAQFYELACPNEVELIGELSRPG
jgi:hypothetical protein